MLRLVLAAAFAALLIRVNAAFFFQTPHYPVGEAAANTLSVLRAERFQEIHGAPSHWGFRHPGPALLYGEAAAEAVSRSLRLVPAPYNAQLLFTAVMLLCFLAAGISVAARWMRSGVFVVLTIGLAALHFAAVDGNKALFSVWTPYVTPVLFFALLVAAASVAAGQGDDLGLLVLAGCLLLHLHVAQPLFVGPLLVFAYGGLLWSCWRRRLPVTTPTPLATEGATVSLPKPMANASAAPWRVYPRTHRFACLLVGVFALPLLVDLLSGAQSNFHQIVEHLRTHRGEGHPLLASLDYFLRFAVYQPSLPHEAAAGPDTVSQPDLVRFVSRHPEMMLLWLGALLAPLLPLAVRLWRGEDAPLLGDAPSVRPAAYVSPPGRWRFLGCLWLAWALSVGLTLSWGRLQDGDLLYTNAWFDYAIWFVLAVLAAGAVVDALDAFASRSERPLVWRGGVSLVCLALVAAFVQRHPQPFLADDDADARTQDHTVVTTLDNEPAGTPRAKLLLFPPDARQAATGVAVTLLRQGRDIDVLPLWSNLFGDNLVLKHWEDYVTGPVETNPPFEVWQLVPANLAPAAFADRPLVNGYTLVPGGLPIDPAREFALTCGGDAPNYAGYVVSGWSPPDDHTCWTEGKTSWLAFRPRPVPAGANVSLRFDFTPYLPTGKRESQRIEAYFNGLDLGTLSVTAQDGAPNQFVVPGATWNKYASALLVLKFPDAISPRETTGRSDARLLAFRMRGITFATTAPAEATNPATPEVEPAPAPTPAPTPMPEPAPELAPVPTPEPPVEPMPSPAVSPPPEPTGEPMASPTPPEMMPVPEPTVEPAPSPTPETTPGPGL